MDVTYNINSLFELFDYVAVDTLGYEQLMMDQYLSPKIKQRFYLGDEGTCSMYIDAVKEEYAKSSYSVRRDKFINFEDAFKAVKFYNE